jgi:hypothetical protein
MPPYEHFEGRRFAAADEALQQLPVGLAFLVTQPGPPQVAEHFTELAGRHRPSRGTGVSCPLRYYCRVRFGSVRDFATGVWQTRPDDLFRKQRIKPPLPQ